MWWYQSRTFRRWTVKFCTAKRAREGHSVSPLCIKCSQSIHHGPHYQLHLVQYGTAMTTGLQLVKVVATMLQSPLHAAVVDNKVLFTKLLLDHGADIDAVDAGGHRPIDLATKNQSDDCVAAITSKLGLCYSCFVITSYCYYFYAVGQMRGMIPAWKSFFPLSYRHNFPFLWRTRLM